MAMCEYLLDPIQISNNLVSDMLTNVTLSQSGIYAASNINRISLELPSFQVGGRCRIDLLHTDTSTLPGTESELEPAVV